MSYHDFTYQQKCTILNHYKDFTYKKLGEMLDLDPQDICEFIKSEGLRKNKKREPNIWTEQEIQFLKENYDIYSRHVLAKRLNKTENNVKAKITELSLIKPEEKKHYVNIDVKPHKRSVVLTQEQEDFLKTNYNRLALEDIAKSLNITKSQAYDYANNILKLQKFGHIVQTGFNYYDLKTIREFYGIIPPRELCKLLPKFTWKQIERKAKEMKIAPMRMTYPENKVKEILEKHGISYISQVKHYFNEKLYVTDFEVNDIAIEVQGDYWHGNPNKYSKSALNETQLKMIERDNDKKKCLESINLKVIYIWEFDLHQKPDECEKLLLNELEGHYETTKMD